MQIMQPEKREPATVPIPPVRRGIDSRAPILQQNVGGCQRDGQRTNSLVRVSEHP